jgi:hypothetical protein
MDELHNAIKTLAFDSGTAVNLAGVEREAA